jgi:hypothetical protein
MTNAQKTRLQALLRRREWRENEMIWSDGTPASFGVLVGEGKVLIRDKPELEAFTCGAFLGDVNAILSDSIVSSTCVAATKGWGYVIDREDLKVFFSQNPGKAGESSGKVMKVILFLLFFFLLLLVGTYLCFLDTTFVDCLSEPDKIRRRKLPSDGFAF